MLEKGHFCYTKNTRKTLRDKESKGSISRGLTDSRNKKPKHQN